MVATDLVGAKFLCMLTEQLEEHDTFFCVPISDARLTRLEGGELDLLDVFRTPEIDELYVGDFRASENGHLLMIEPTQDVPVQWYPDEGFFLTPHEATETATIEARERGRAIIHFALNPPESREALQIEVQHLASGLQVFQNLVRHAYSRAIRPLSRTTRELLADKNNYQIEVFGFSRGSFTVNMQSKVGADDLLGSVNIEKALSFVDDAIAASNDPEDPERAIRFLRENTGHFLTAYRALLEFVVENGSPLKYEWATPGSSADQRSAMSVDVATELYEILNREEYLTTELVTLVGVVTVINTNTWAILDEEEGVEYSGKVPPDSTINLHGITTRTERYQFECEERLQEFTATGKEKIERLLLNYRKL
jgi:hypothetical protein